MLIPDPSRSRLRTARCLAHLCIARMVVATLPFRWWRETLGDTGIVGWSESVPLDARRTAAHVEWAAKLLPFETKCLPRAMALSWILRSGRVRHCVVFAVRPLRQRHSNDQLHAWVEVDGVTILGNLPGDWVETLRLGDK
ncbi:MAG: lasso peptide biosynthesis B2 protein [Sphingomicrobium sp.]